MNIIKLRSHESLFKLGNCLILALSLFSLTESCLGEPPRHKSLLESFEEKIASRNPVLIVIAPWAASDPKKGGGMVTFSDIKCSLISDPLRIDEFCKGIRKYQVKAEMQDMRGEEYSLVFVFGGGESFVAARLLRKKSGAWFFIFQNPGDNPNKDRGIIAAGEEMVAILDKNFIRKWDANE